MWDRRHFRGDFPDLLNKFVEDAEICLVEKQQTQICRKTPIRIVNKFNHFSKVDFEVFLNQFSYPPYVFPHWFIRIYHIEYQFFGNLYIRILWSRRKQDAVQTHLKTEIFEICWEMWVLR